MEELLRLENISYRYDEGRAALNNVSLVFHRGERVAVLGKNGAGKSTFFRCCNGVLRPQSGRILLEGQEITNKKQDIMKLRQAVGLIFQEPDSQIIAGTVEDEISFGPMNLRLPEAEVQTRVADAIERMNLKGFETRAPQYLSGGEKKRVSIADILAMKPEIILLDEPAAALDPENVTLLESALDELTDTGIALVVCTHDVDFAYRFANRAVVFSGGEVIADSDIEQVFLHDEIISEAHIRKPLLFEAAKLLGERFPEKGDYALPRNVGEFSDYVDTLVSEKAYRIS